ncbi:MAG TPA: peptidylprolyl isomerase [Kofleriaceae bacterium]|nr:peptidylprolyl isomerase [Kofleriaceae bacterium]
MRAPLSAVLLLVGLGACGDATPASPDASPDADPNDPRPVVVLSTTKGDLVVRLEPDAMPITTANFLAYVDGGWYDGTLIHRVVPDWVIQGGGYTTGLTPKQTMPPIGLETSPRVPHVHGAISMARTQDPDSATSQWFIVDWPHDSTGPQRDLDGQYAAFGNLIEGFDVLDAIVAVPTHATGSLEDVPVDEITVTHAARR